MSRLGLRFSRITIQVSVKLRLRSIKVIQICEVAIEGSVPSIARLLIASVQVEVKAQLRIEARVQLKAKADVRVGIAKLVS